MTGPYHVGDHVSYASTGVCRVAEIRTEPAKGKEPEKTFYVLKPVADPGSTVFVPTTSQALLAKMHPLPTKEEIAALISAAREDPLPWQDDRKIRANDHLLLLKSCDLEQLLRLAACIHRQRRVLTAKNKKLSSSDEGTLRRAEHLLQNELSFVLEIPADQVGEHVRRGLED